MSPFDVAWTLLKEEEEPKVPKLHGVTPFHATDSVQMPNPIFQRYQERRDARRLRDTKIALSRQREKERSERLKGMNEGTHPRPYAEFSGEELDSLQQEGAPVDPFQRQAAIEEEHLRDISAYGMRGDLTGSQFGSNVGFDSDFQEKRASEPFDLAWTMVHQNRR
jgi:hypothetical protein|tara:strand:- start:2505 stop:2999 length:495 start_codon:yes stop_codon:yes gene_type:complete